MAQENREPPRRSPDQRTQRGISILRLPAVKARTGLPRSTIYARIAQGEFPSPVRLGPRTVGWLESEVEDWLQARIDESRKAAA
jgi:prophage regulatory protein